MTTQTESQLSTVVPLADALLEIQQIECEQRLICEQICRIDLEKQRLQQLLNVLRSTKANHNRQHYEIHSTDSESDYDSDE